MLATPDDRAAIPVELIGTAHLPDGGRLQLLRRGDDYSIRFGDNELMGNQVRHSEEALATLVCGRLSRPDSHILIGGLGMGFTLGAALRSLPVTATITVAELLPEIVDWANGTLAHLFHDYLADPRVTVAMADVHDVIDRADGAFDAILLDVDNGPDGLIHIANERLYCNWGLRAAHAALKPGGILAIWSAYPDDEFVGRLEQARFAVEEISVPAIVDGDDLTHTIWLAARQD
ncbi:MULTISPECIES: spermidine synthase family protein [Sphingobium]|uniref:spermidine synthase n=1 Tax=Sphingobium sp. MI1205 TaxID=407020 RepID=UPI000770646F|nr:spermidine synthase [Sphingobium sp. MI1205]AMK20093.1 spermidine synthase [Sphingobium sp. MI1205]